MMDAVKEPTPTLQRDITSSQVTSEDRLVGLIIKYRVPAADVPLAPEHFHDHDLRCLWVRWTKRSREQVDQFDVDSLRAGTGPWIKFIVWLADAAAAPDPNNPIDPRAEIATLAERIRGNDLKPIEPASAKPPPKIRTGDGAVVIPGTKTLRWTWVASRQPGLTHLEAHVLFCIFGHIKIGSKKGSGEGFPSYDTIAAIVGADPRNVKRAVSRLIELCLISVAPGGGRHRPNTYRLCLPGRLAAALSEEEDGEAENGAPSGAQPETPRERRTGKHPLPPDWSPDSSTFKRALDILGGDDAKVRREIDKFINWHRSNGKKRDDWNAAFLKWCLDDFGKSGAKAGYHNANDGTPPQGHPWTKIVIEKRTGEPRCYGGRWDWQWFDAVAKLVKDGTWDTNFAPERPGATGSSCPGEILEHFGLMPRTRESPMDPNIVSSDARRTQGTTPSSTRPEKP
jgi:DnaT DNA-binding domain